MTTRSIDLSQGTALPLPADENPLPPNMIHLLPAGEITTFDGRGPYRVPDVEA